MELKTYLIITYYSFQILKVLFIFSKNDPTMNKIISRWWVWLVGAGIALLAELAHELIENSEWMIQDC